MAEIWTCLNFTFIGKNKLVKKNLTKTGNTFIPTIFLVTFLTRISILA